MKMGTRSLIFGVHAVWFHPLTVWCAWTALYGKFPKWWEAVAIFFHDVGYAGCDGMDTEEGRRHPLRGAAIAGRVVLRAALLLAALRHPLKYGIDQQLTLDLWCEAFELAAETYRLSLGHSRFYAAQAGIQVSKLFAADKASIYFDPRGFYLLRARLSGELDEYIANSGTPNATPKEWFDSYVRLVGELI